MNWQPEYPDGEDSDSLEKHKLDMKSEMEKARPDQWLMSQKMAMSFALTRRDLNKNLPIAEIKEQWPALFNVSMVCIRHVQLLNLYNCFA